MLDLNELTLADLICEQHLGACGPCCVLMKQLLHATTSLLMLQEHYELSSKKLRDAVMEVT